MKLNPSIKKINVLKQIRFKFTTFTLLIYFFIKTKDKTKLNESDTNGINNFNSLIPSG